MVAILPRPQREAGLEVIEGAQAPDFQPPHDDYTGDVMYLPSKPTDDQIGDVLIQDWQGRYAHFYGTWYEYQHGVWLPAKNLRHQIWEKMKWLRHTGGCSELRPSANRVAGIEAYLSEYLRADEPAENMNYINLQNGIFNLEKNRLEEHRKDLFMTSQLPFAYDPDAGYSQFIQFLQSTLVLPDAQPDWQMIKVLQEAMGYSLTASTDYRVSFWLVGESGTGKSVMINVLIALAGNSHASVDLDALSNNPYQLADIAGKRLVTFTEPRANGVLADGHYKRLVSQDTIMARQIFGKPFTFVPVCKVWGAMNDTPRVVDRSDAVFNRVIIIPMNRLVSPENRDPRLINKLEAELAGIFNWALIGWKRLQKAGKFSTADQIEQARADYKAENDNESQFIASEGLLDEASYSRSQMLYDRYAAWCKRNGMTPKSSVKVSRDWKRLGFKMEHTRTGNIWWGLSLKIDESGDIT